MNDDRSFERLLADRMEAERRGAQLPDAFYDDFQSLAGRMRQRPRWLALIKEPPMRISSHLAVGSPTARVTAIMVATLLLVLVVAGAGIAGSQLVSPAPEEEATFPTGTFVAAEWSDRFVEFNDDGTCLWVFRPGGSDMGCTYVIHGNLITQTSIDEDWIGPSGYEPLTYLWDYDGEHLTFLPHGEDMGLPGTGAYLTQPWRYVPDPRLVVIADFDIAAGTELMAGHTDLRVLPGADVPVDALDHQDLATGRVAATEIAQDTVLTPDLFQAE